MRFVVVTIKRIFVFMDRYSVIDNKRKREIVLLIGSGCAYKKCAFCDYHLDRSDNADERYAINGEALSRVTGVYGELEIINSGSVFELDERTLELIKSVCRERGIKVVHFEAHYIYENKIDKLRRDFDGFTLKMKLGLETFDFDLREHILHKGIAEREPKRIARSFDEANFLFGIRGQTVRSMKKDIEQGLKLFERICINVMCENSTDVKPDPEVIGGFMRELYPIYKDDERVDILIDNKDFGVGD